MMFNKYSKSIKYCFAGIFFLFSYSNLLIADEIPSYPLMTIVKNVSCSSFLKNKNKPQYNYHPINLFDEDSKTAWFEGKNDEGLNEYVEFEFFTTIDIFKLSVINGYAKSEKLFKANNRVKRFKVIINGDKNYDINLLDTMDKQTIKVDFRKVSTISFVIKEVYKGDQYYYDTGVSEFSFNAIPVCNGKGIAEKEVKNIFTLLNNQSEYASKGIALLKEQLGTMRYNQATILFEKSYLSFDGSGNDNRLYLVAETIIAHSRFIPSLLKAIYNRSGKGLFSSESDYEDPYSTIAKLCFDNKPTAIPILRHLGPKKYQAFYNLLELGDTRVVIELLSKLTYDKDKVYAECCRYMPSEILAKYSDNYAMKVIKKYLDKKEVSKDLENELRKVDMRENGVIH